MSKYTLEDVAKIVFNKSNGKCNLISKKYISLKNHLEIQCGCGNVFKCSLASIKNRMKLQCQDCTNKEASERNRRNIKDVINYIDSTGCKYISGEYLNGNSILTIKCRCGNIFKKKFVKFKYGQDRCPNCGAKSSTQSKIKYTADYVQDIVNKERGYNIDKDKFSASYKPVPCTCSKGHKFNLRFDWYLRGQSGCHECQVEFQRGENAPGWKGGTSEIIDRLRKTIKEWKLEVMAYYGFKCSVTGEYEQTLAIHHLKSFIDIVNEVSRDLNIPIHRKLSDYDNLDDYYKLEKEVVRRHTIDNGIVLKREIHNKYHNEYGRGGNTPEQFNEFLVNNYGFTLEEIRNRKSDLYIPKVC